MIVVSYEVVSYLHRWFINGVTRQDAEEMLLERNPSSGSFTQKDGAFLVRPSETSKGDFSISVKLVPYLLSKPELVQIFM